MRIVYLFINLLSALFLISACNSRTIKFRIISTKDVDEKLFVLDRLPQKITYYSDTMLIYYAKSAVMSINPLTGKINSLYNLFTSFTPNMLLMKYKNVVDTTLILNEMKKINVSQFQPRMEIEALTVSPDKKIILLTTINYPTIEYKMIDNERITHINIEYFRILGKIDLLNHTAIFDTIKLYSDKINMVGDMPPTAFFTIDSIIYVGRDGMSPEKGRKYSIFSNYSIIGHKYIGSSDIFLETGSNIHKVRDGASMMHFYDHLQTEFGNYVDNELSVIDITNNLPRVTLTDYVKGNNVITFFHTSDIMLNNWLIEYQEIDSQKYHLICIDIKTHDLEELDSYQYRKVWTSNPNSKQIYSLHKTNDKYILSTYRL